MSWARLDDRFHENRKVTQAWLADRASVGLHVMAITYCAGHETDGFVDEMFVLVKLPAVRERTRAIAALVQAGLWQEVDDGWQINDYLEFNPSKADLERTRSWDRTRKDLFRDPDLIAAIRERDRDRCRYCGTLVNWKDRRSQTGGTYDHVTPRGPNTLENVVVACRGCNMRKGPRTPHEASMPLLDPDQIRSSSDLARGPDLSIHPTRPVLKSLKPSSTSEPYGHPSDVENQRKGILS